MSNDEKKKTSLSLFLKTKKRLALLKHTGQSDDGFLQDLMDYWEKGHPKAEVEHPGR